MWWWCGEAGEAGKCCDGGEAGDCDEFGEYGDGGEAGDRDEFGEYGECCDGGECGDGGEAGEDNLSLGVFRVTGGEGGEVWQDVTELQSVTGSHPSRTQRLF